MQNMETGTDHRTQLEFVIPSRGLIGFRVSLFEQQGRRDYESFFFEYRPSVGDFEQRRNGVLISFEEGVATFYS